MSQSLLYHAFGCGKVTIIRRRIYQDGCIRFVLAVQPDWIACPVCGGKEVVRKGRRFRELQTVPIGLKPVFLVTEVPKCQCAACGKRFEVAPPLPRPMPATRTGSKRSSKTCAGRMTISDLAALTGLGLGHGQEHRQSASWKRTTAIPGSKNSNASPLTRFIWAGESGFTRWSLTWTAGGIVWVAHGRGGDTLRKFWRALRLSKAKIEAVAMDMSPAYWSAVLEHLPEAAIVFDRFHIAKLVNEKLDDLRRAMVREATGPMQQTVKGVRYLLLMRRDNVDESRSCPSCRRRSNTTNR